LKIYIDDKEPKDIKEFADRYFNGKNVEHSPVGDVVIC